MVMGPIIAAVIATLGIVAVASAADTRGETRTRARDTAARGKRTRRRRRAGKKAGKPPTPDTAPVSKGLSEPHTVKVEEGKKRATKRKKKGRRRALTPKRAAFRLYAYVSTTISAGKARTLGSKGAPNKKVGRYQRAMGGLRVDNIYGPKTRARGKALTGRTFPRRTSKVRSSRRTTTPEPELRPTSSTPQRAPAPPPPDEPVATAAPEETTDIVLASTAPTTAPTTVEPTEGRTKKRAALDLLLHARAAPSGDGRGAWFGYRDHPNEVVRAAQQDMGGLVDDGIYGPKSKARGKELTGQDFPRR